MGKKSGGGDLAIDRSQLEVEWERQAGLYWDAAEKLAEARRNLDDLETDLIVKKADVDLKIRQSPDDYGLEKATEAGIKEAKDSDRGVIKLKRKINEARYLVNLLEGKCRALEHKKRALEKETDLFLSGYFAAPKEKRGRMAPNGSVKMPAGVRKKRRDEDDDED